MPKAFRCSRTGVMFPPDYIEEWGRKYGIGLGPEPVSEALVNDYYRDIVGEHDGMHGLSVCRAQVDLVEVTDAEFEAAKAILDIDDPKLKARATLMRNKQLVKSSKMMNRYPNDVAPARAFLAAKTPVQTELNLS